MLDRDAGGFSLAPVDVTVPAGRRYLPGTNVIETTWMTRTGWLIVADALTIGPWHDDEERRETFVRSPTDHRSEKVLLRTITCANGRSTWSSTANRYSSTGAPGPSGPTRWGRLRRGARPARGIRLSPRLTTDLRLGLEGPSARAPDDERGRDRVALSWDNGQPPTSAEQAVGRMKETIAYWRRWLGGGRFPDHPWRTHLERSALTLKGLRSRRRGRWSPRRRPVPETPRGERNWDYRYT